jgi:hypothetical protein
MRRIWTVERRFFLYVIVVQVLIIGTLYLALASPRTLDMLTSERTVRGVTTEGPVDRYTGLLLASGALCSLMASAVHKRNTGRVKVLWTGYGILLGLFALEEADWLRWLLGRDARVGGWPIGSLHDLLEKLSHDLQSGSPDYVLSAPVVVGFLFITSVVTGTILYRLSRVDEMWDVGLVILVGLGFFLGGAGLLIDADVLPKPVGIDWKAHIEEPLEAIGALCLLIVSLEGVGRAVPDRKTSGVRSRD